MGDDCDDIDPTLNAQDADGDGQSSVTVTATNLTFKYSGAQGAKLMVSIKLVMVLMEKMGMKMVKHLWRVVVRIVMIGP